jgi:nucleoside phosphorylase
MPETAGSDATVRVDAAVLTALPVETRAVVTALGGCSVHRSRGRDLNIGELSGGRVLVFPLDGMGNVGAAQAAQHVMATWSPGSLLLVGIAGGLPKGADDLQLGDVLVPDQVVGYELGKVTDAGTQPRFESYRPGRELLAAAQSLRPAEWALKIVTPRPGDSSGRTMPMPHFGPVLSGEKVQAGGPSVDELRKIWPKAIGTEMEGLGVALAAYRNGLPSLMVKAVTDFADTAKDDDWHPYAAEAAARFAIAVLDRSMVRRDEIPRPPAAPLSTPRIPGPVKVDVCRGLVDCWEDVASYFAIPKYEKARFRHGAEPTDLWDWLDARKQLGELPAALDYVGRADLAGRVRSALT